jgi:predicted kinase
VEAAIFVGIQASGKSSFYRKQFFDTHLRINLDMLKTRHRERILLRACIEAKQPFVVDNTNPTIEERARYIEIARSGGFRVVGYYFRSPPKEALTRNARRTGKARIPDKGILGTHKRLRVPRLEEGFDELYCVRMDGTRCFLVEEWSDEL